MEKRKVLRDWGYMAYLERGEGDPVVFVHGAGNRAEIWARLFDGLPDYHRVIAVDLPGHGDSSCYQINSVEGFAREIRGFLDELDLENVTLAGHSMGGAITIKVASTDHRVTRGILVGTGARLKVNPRLLDGLRDDFRPWVANMAKWSFLKGAPGELVQEAMEMMIEAGREVLYNDMYACSTYSGEEELDTFPRPALIACGENDIMTPPELSKELSEKIKGSALKLIPGAGHMVHLEQPGALAEAILAFLKE